MNFNCDECCDTETIDRAGEEIACPYCVGAPVEVKITGLGHGLGRFMGPRYATMIACTGSTITFFGSRSEIWNDVRSIRQEDELKAHSLKIYGRTSISSGAITVAKRVWKALNP